MTGGASNPLLIKKRIKDNGKLWGAVVQFQGKLRKITKEYLITVIESDNPNRQVLVDFPEADIPVTLTTITVNGKPVLRTVWDNTIKNNFHKVPAIKLVSANKLRILKP